MQYVFRFVNGSCSSDEPAKEYFAGSEPVVTAITVGASALENFGQTAEPLRRWPYFLIRCHALIESALGQSGSFAKPQIDSD
jgi:hypothetical protein